jgi:hypothetical protein
MRRGRPPATIANMSRSAIGSSSKRTRLKALPWATVAQAGLVIARRWRALSGNDRARLARLLRDSGGRPGNLRPKERKELRKLAGKLDLKGMSRELMTLGRGRGGRRKRGRCPVP